MMNVSRSTSAGASDWWSVFSGSVLYQLADSPNKNLGLHQNCGGARYGVSDHGADHGE